MTGWRRLLPSSEPARRTKEAGGWSLAELRRLPGAWIRRLSDFYTEWEAQSAWPESATRAIIALIPKPGAETEGQLRPTGLFTYTCRVWQAIRKRDLQQWSLTLHGGAHEDLATRALRTAASIELAQWLGGSTFASLHCSKCFERIEHRAAGDRALASGMPAQVINLVVDIDACARCPRLLRQRRG